MITSELFKECEKKYIASGLLKFGNNVQPAVVDITLNLTEFLFTLITVYNVRHYTYNLNNISTDPSRTHRSIENIFRITKFYKPEVTLEEVTEELFELNRLQRISYRYCPTIAKCTFYPNGSRYSDFRINGACYDRQGHEPCTVGEYLKYYTAENVQERKAAKAKVLAEQQKPVKNTQTMQKAINPQKGGYRIKVLTRHPSHFILRTALPKLAFRSVFRLGSTTEIEDIVEKGGHRVEINSVEGIKNSASKRRMKECFTAAEVPTADWFIVNAQGKFIQKSNDAVQGKTIVKEELPYPLIAKQIFGSRGTGNYYIENIKDLNAFLVGKDLNVYIFEKYYTFNREYRLHVTSEGCFYTCRKMLKKDAAEGKKFQRHSDNCVWIVEENPQFEKPVNWQKIEQACVTALEGLGLDIGAFDVKVQNATDKKGKKREDPQFILIESCSAASFGDITAQKYIEIIPQLAVRIAQECGVI